MPAHILQLDYRKALSPRAQMRLQRAVRGGELVIFPTDTVYGLGCDACNQAALQKIYALKGRDPQRPLSTHLHRVSDLERYCHPLTPPQKKWIGSLLPGPYTLILQASKKSPVASVSADGKVGLRVPDSESFRCVAQAANVPLVGTSVNRSGEPALIDIDEIIEKFSAEVDLIVVTDEPMSNENSTVIDLTEKKPKILRGLLPAHLKLE